MMKKILLIIIALFALALLPISNAAASFDIGFDETYKTTCATETVLYVVNIVNTGTDDDTFTISLSGSASKWAVAAPTGFVLDSGSSENVYVYVTPQKGALIGDYDLIVTATGASAGSHSITASVNVDECHAADLNAITTSQSICAEDIADYSVTLENNGFWAENFDVALSGTASEWAAVSPELIRLDSGETDTLSVFIRPAESVTGDYGLTLTANSRNSDATTSINLGLNIKGCYDYSATVEQNYQSFCENSELKLPITISNDGTVSNTFNLEIEGPDWAVLETDKITIAAGQDGLVRIIMFPGVGIGGDYPIRVTITPEKGDVSSTVTITANILTCYGSTIEIAQKSDTICPGTSKTYAVGVSNPGAFDSNYAFLVEGAEWATLSNSFSMLTPGQLKNIDLQVNPGSTVDPGEYTITLTSVSQELAQIIDSDEIIINVAQPSSCFGVRTTAQESKVEVAYGESSLIPIVIENVGSEEVTYNLDVSGTGANYAQLNPSSVTLAGHSSDTVFLHVAVPEATERGVYLVTVSARSDGEETVSSSSNLAIHVTEAPAVLQVVEEPEEMETPENVTKNITEQFPPVKSHPLGGFDAKLRKWAASFRGYFPVSLEETSTSFIIASASVLIIILIVILYVSGIFRRISEWLDEEELEIIEEIELEERREKKKTKKDKPKKSIWQRFNEWLEEDVDIEESKSKPDSKPRKPVKKDKGIWQRFSSWLEEDFEETSKKPTQKVPAKRPSKSKKQKSAWERFSDWLDEDIGGSEEKPKPRRRRKK